MSDLWVVKSRRIYDGVEITSVLTRPLARGFAEIALAEWNADYQNPGNYYIEKWEER
jgi:hypothetical protein